MFPFVFALLPTKTEATYTQCFQEIFNRINAILSTDILLDFKRSAVNAINNVQPLVENKGCFYHSCPYVWKHIQHLGMQLRHNQD